MRSTCVQRGAHERGVYTHGMHGAVTRAHGDGGACMLHVQSRKGGRCMGRAMSERHLAVGPARVVVMVQRSVRRM